MSEVMDTTWAKVVESDEVYSPKTKVWYEVQQRITLPNGKIKIKAKGVRLYWPPQDPAGSVKVRRGATGRVVDLFEVIFSGATVPETVGITKAIGPTMDDTMKGED